MGDRVALLKVRECQAHQSRFRREGGRSRFAALQKSIVTINENTMGGRAKREVIDLIE